MAGLVEDHVARNLSRLPDFGVELPTMEFNSVSQLSSVVYSTENWATRERGKLNVNVFEIFRIKQVARLDGEIQRPSSCVAVSTDLSYLRADLFDHRAANFHPL